MEPLVPALTICKYLGIPIQSLYGLVNAQKIPFRKVGHLLRFNIPEVDAWTIELAKHRKEDSLIKRKARWKRGNAKRKG